jgi:hypothetical protein
LEYLTKFSTPGILFLLTLASGIWVSNSGKPYNTIIFNIHKLIALGAVVVFAIQFFNTLKSTGIQSLLVALIVLAVLCVIALFATGAMMSIGKPDYTTFLRIHQIAPVALVIALAAIIYLVIGKNS